MAIEPPGKRLPARDDEIRRLLEAAGVSENLDLASQILATALRLIDEGTGRAELKIVSRTLRELGESFRVFAPYAGIRKVCVFGSARIPGDLPEYRLAQEFARTMVARGFMVITGAGGGLMQAANEGAGREQSFGCHIRLPYEVANAVVERDKKLLSYRYFFTRKLTFVKETDGLAVFPGGFGTLDECFEALTLVQTGKSNLLPIVFVDQPGGGYWRSLERHLREQLLGRGLISPEDLCLYRITEDVEEAVREVAGFYRNFHSLRYVGDRTVIRHHHPLGEAAVCALRRDFQDILVQGRLDASDAVPEEANEPQLASLRRLVLRFNRRSYGRLRQLIDRLNQEC